MVVNMRLPFLPCGGSNLKDKKVSTTLAGVSGEYFVAAELSRRGYIASITLRNTKGIDILASNGSATRSVGIQVKTSRGSKPEWILNQNAEGYISTNLFYVFVNLPPTGESPSFHIVPSTEVANFARDNHRLWLQTPGRGGTVHNDTPMRKYIDRDHTFRDRWQLLGLD